MPESTQDERPAREAVIDDAASKRLVRGVWLFTLSRPSTISLGLAVELIAVALPLVISPENAPLAILFAVLFPPLFVYTMYRTASRRLIATAPIGSRFAVRLGESAISMESPIGSAEISYAAYRRVLARRHIVVLQQRSDGAYGAFPRELFTEADLDYLRAAIGAA